MNAFLLLVSTFNQKLLVATDFHKLVLFFIIMEVNGYQLLFGHQQSWKYPWTHVIAFITTGFIYNSLLNKDKAQHYHGWGGGGGGGQAVVLKLCLTMAISQ